MEDRHESPQGRNPDEQDSFGETQTMPRVSRRRRGAHSNLRDRLRGVSGLALAMIGIGAVVLVVILLIAMTLFVMRQSSQTISAAPTPTLLIQFATLVPGITPSRAPRPTATLPASSPRSGSASPAEASTIVPGGFVEVQGTGTLGVRLRTGPGLNYTTSKVADEGTRFKVLEGPDEADDLDWWRVQTQDGTIGWAAATYLKPSGGFE